MSNRGTKIQLFQLFGLSCHFVFLFVKKSWKEAVLYILVPDIWLKGENASSYALSEELEVCSGVDSLYIYN